MCQRQTILAAPLVPCHAARGQMAPLKAQLAAEGAGPRALLSDAVRVGCKHRLPSLASSLSLYSALYPTSEPFLKRPLAAPSLSMAENLLCLSAGCGTRQAPCVATSHGRSRLGMEEGCEPRMLPVRVPGPGFHPCSRVTSGGSRWADDDLGDSEGFSEPETR